MLITSQGFASPELCKSLHRRICSRGGGVAPKRDIQESVWHDGTQRRDIPVSIWTCMLFADGGEDGIAVQWLIGAELDVEELYEHWSDLTNAAHFLSTFKSEQSKGGTCLRRCLQS